jgi:5'-methylthioadenosine phosphorylase
MPIGFIGGSGVYDALELEEETTETIHTPYGEPSSSITVGELNGTDIAFLPRHGKTHRYSPTTVPYRANIHALKQLGCERVLSSNAVGSLRENLPPRTLSIPDQIFDRTKHRTSTFFEDLVVHMGFAEPYCPQMVEHLSEAAAANHADYDQGGTYVCIEGPQFSTKAESAFYRAQGFDIIGMTAIPEAKLAREAEMCYATVAGVTDYDVWREGSEVTQEAVAQNAIANEAVIKDVIQHAVDHMPEGRECDCGHSLDGAIVTAADGISDATQQRVELLAGDYLNTIAGGDHEDTR